MARKNHPTRKQQAHKSTRVDRTVRQVLTSVTTLTVVTR